MTDDALLEATLNTQRKPKPIKILSYQTSRCGKYVDLTAVVPVLNPIHCNQIWGYTRATLRCIPLQGRTLDWDKWRGSRVAVSQDNLFEMWKRLGVLPATL